MDLEIGISSEDELPELLRIYNHAVAHTLATFDVEPQTLRQRRKWFREHDSRYPLVSARLGGRTVGYCCISRFREKYGYRKTAELSVYVDEPERGRGIGKALMLDILARAKDLGYHSVVSFIAESNCVSIRMHESLGFEKAGLLKEAGYKFGAWQSVFIMQKLL